MPRSIRIMAPGEFFHVCHKGNYGQPIFSDDYDYIYYLKLLEKYKYMYGLDVFAYCLMSNHVHLVVRPTQDDSMVMAIGRTHQRYAVYFNKKIKRQGHLWQERFYSCLLQGNHFIAAVRYTERNPVRAGIVKYPWDYTWSSAREHIGIKYNIISLKDLFEFTDISNWRNFIEVEENQRQLEDIRHATARYGALGQQDNVGKRGPGRPFKNK